MSASSDLRAAREKIADPDHWTKGGFGQVLKDSLDFLQPYELSYATCFCAAGSLYAVTGGNEGPKQAGRYRVAVQYLIEAIPDSWGPDDVVHRSEEDLFDYNDHPETTHADVLALFDRAIAAADKAVEAVSA